MLITMKLIAFVLLHYPSSFKYKEHNLIHLFSFKQSDTLNHLATLINQPILKFRNIGTLAFPEFLNSKSSFYSNSLVNWTAGYVTFLFSFLNQKYCQISRNVELFLLTCQFIGKEELSSSLFMLPWDLQFYTS